MILVIGATGQIGGEVVKQLTSQGIRVRALVRNPQKAAALAGPLVEIVAGDLDQPETLAPAFAGIEKVFLVTSGSPEQVHQQGNAVKAARQAGVKHLVKVSALGTDAQSPVALGRWHAETEREIRESGLAYTFLHPTYFMQNFLGNAGSIQAEGAIYAPMKDGKVPYVDAADIAAVGVAALTRSGHEGRTYVITGGEAISYAEAAERIGTAIGKPVRYVDVPPEATRQALSAAGLPDWFVEDLLALFAFFSTGAAAEVSPVVEQTTGRKPRSFEAFAQAHAEVFRGAPAPATV